MLTCVRWRNRTSAPTWNGRRHTTANPHASRCPGGLVVPVARSLPQPGRCCRSSQRSRHLPALGAAQRLEQVVPVGRGGIEPPTSVLSGPRSNRLSYPPSRHLGHPDPLPTPTTGCAESNRWGLPARLERARCLRDPDRFRSGYLRRDRAVLSRVSYRALLAAVRRPGSDEGSRSPDLRVMSALLCQLSYVTVCGRRRFTGRDPPTARLAGRPPSTPPRRGPYVDLVRPLGLEPRTL